MIYVFFNIGISCYDKSTYCSNYQIHTEFCNNSYSLFINNTFLTVPDACQLSCGRCISVQRLNDINSSVEINANNNLILKDEEEENYTNESTTILGRNMLFSRVDKCFDQRDDCLIQKACGFCGIFNEKYPYDCIKTCHPDCAFHS